MSLRQYSLFTDNGELISTTLTKKPNLKGDWIVFYKKPLKELAKSDADLSAIKIYLWLSGKQTFENYVMTTRKNIQEELKLSKSTVQRALKWLVNNGYLIIANVEGNTGFLLNPTVTTKGAKNKTERQTLWQLAKERNEIINEQSNVEQNAVDQ